MGDHDPSTLHRRKTVYCVDRKRRTALAHGLNGIHGYSYPLVAKPIEIRLPNTLQARKSPSGPWCPLSTPIKGCGGQISPFDDAIPFPVLPMLASPSKSRQRRSSVTSPGEKPSDDFDPYGNVYLDLRTVRNTQSNQPMSKPITYAVWCIRPECNMLKRQKKNNQNVTNESVKRNATTRRLVSSVPLRALRAQ